MSQPVIVLIDGGSFRPEVEYTFGYLLSLGRLSHRVVLFEHVNGAVESPVIIYADHLPENRPRKYVWIKPSTQFWQNYLKSESLPQPPFAECEGIPVLFAGDERSVQQSDESLTTDFDVVSSAFFLLTRYEEYLISARDQHGRFSARSSVLSGTRTQRIPLVNLYSRLLGRWLQSIFGPDRGEIEGSSFHYLLTHDIDHLRLHNGFRGETRTLASLFLRRRSITGSLRFLASKARTSLAGGVDPYQTLDHLMNLSEKRGAVSTFFFMTARQDPHDGSYAPDSPELREEVRIVVRRGHEIGLHGSYHSFADYEEMAEQRRRLEEISSRQISHFRQHYLRFVAPDSWKSQAEAGFEADFSLGYADEIGFRAGTATPFLPFDLRQRRTIDILEFSNMIMDVTLFESAYLALPQNEAMARCSDMIDQVRSVNGVLVLLWHNSSLTDVIQPGWRSFYSELLSLLDAKGGVPTSPSSLISEWRSRLLGTATSS